MLPSDEPAKQYIDKSGKIALSSCTTDMRFRDGLVMQWHPPVYYDTSCKPVLKLDPAKYSQPGSFSEGLAAVRDKTKESDTPVGYIDKTGKWIIEPQFIDGGPFKGGLARVKVKAEGSSSTLYAFVDKKGKRITPAGKPGWQAARSFSEGRAAVKVDGGWTFIGSSGAELGSERWFAVGDFSEGLAPVRTRGGWGYVDRDLKMVIEPQFVSAESFSDGWGLVQDGDRFKFVDKKGKTRGSYAQARSFSSGRAAVLNGRWCFLDTKLEFAVKCNYKEVRDFVGDLALVKGWKGEQWGEDEVAWISKDGTTVWGPKPPPAGTQLFDTVAASGVEFASVFFGFMDPPE